jgi:ATP-dependent DNA helicase RecG
MASSLETLVKILKLEQRKGYKNDAVIGGFRRFSRHWAREAHGQAKADTHHKLVDDIAAELSRYDDLKTPEERADLIEVLLTKATGKIPDEMATAVLESPTVAQEESAEALKEPGPAPAQPPPEAKAAPEPSRKPQRKQPKPSRQKPKQPRRKAPRSVRERRGYAGSEAEVKNPATPEDLQTPATSLEGIGPKRAEQLERLGARTIGDLLNLFPRRHDDYSRLKTIDRIELGEQVTVMGTVDRVHARKTRKGRPLFEAVISDGTASLRLIWFNQLWLEKQLKPGTQIVVSGKIDQYLGYLTMYSPEWEPIERELLHTGRVVPVYPLTQGLTARLMRQVMKRMADAWAPRLTDYMPLAIRGRLDLMDLADAVSQAHFPDSWEDLQAARARLAFDELFLMQLGLVRQRLAWQADPVDPTSVEDSWLETYVDALPYQLTGAQQRALDDIRRDLASGLPMNRLLQGDVGSGKTVVAAVGIAMALAAGKQAALMAPTGILCEQHFAALNDLLARAPDNGNGHPPTLRLLTGSLAESEREEVYAGLADGNVQVVVGTHALIQAGVEFADLGLVVIDEQHRFGVQQRGALRGKAADGNPHLLVMTATPIPRTLALTVHADLDLTLLDEMPPGRQPVETRVLSPRERERTYAFLRTQIEQGRQAFIIYPLVEESEKIDARAAVAEYERLQRDIFPDLKLGLLHGQLKPAEKEQAMALFYQGETDILVSTTVIEVGIDVPNASVMLVEGANRFGLAQLHQLRGRVGRGEHASYCLLLSDAEIDPSSANGSNRRLNALEETNDGFRLAEIDWEIRGAGELLGVRQSGFVGRVLFANLMDPRLVESVQREVQALVKADPALQAPEHALLAEEIKRAEAQQNLTPGDIS